MQIVDFYALDRAIQDRFIASTHGREVPAPLLYERPKTNPWVKGLLVTALVLLSLELLFALLGFGRLGHPLAQNRPWAVAVYASLTAATAVTLFFAYWRWDKDNSVPFHRGLYLFPIGVIDATRPAVVVHELTTMSDLRVDSGKLKLVVKSGQSFEFSLPDPAQGEAILATLTQAKTTVTLPPGVNSQRDHVLQNPLLDTGFKNPFGPNEALKPPPFRHPFGFALGALLVGLVLGIGCYPLRNHLSAKLLYAKACRLNTTAAYRAFVQSGARRDDVVEILLPRAELRDAVAKKSVDSIEQFLDSHPKSRIDNEALYALREALLGELEVAKSQNTLTALRQFRAKDPRRLLVEAERFKAETALYRSVLARFQEAAKEPSEHLDFVARLLEYTRKNGTQVDLRFRRRLGDSVEQADSRVKRSTYYVGPAAAPMQYFDEAHSLPRETRAATTLIERWGKVFPSDMLAFQQSAPLPDDRKDFPKVERPTLLITYRIEMSGPFNSNKPRGAFVGVSHVFKAALLIPGDDKPLVVQVTSWNPPNLRKVDEDRIPLADLYEGLAQEGLNRFVSKYQAALFKPQAT